MVHFYFIAFSEITAFQQTQTVLLTAWNLFSSVYNLYKLHLLNAFRLFWIFDNRGTKIITSSGDSTCIMWDIQNAVSLSIFGDHNGDVMSVSMNPQDSNMFVSGSCDSTAAIWDIRNTEQKCIEQYYGKKKMEKKNSNSKSQCILWKFVIAIQKKIFESSMEKLS